LAADLTGLAALALEEASPEFREAMAAANATAGSGSAAGAGVGARIAAARVARGMTGTRLGELVGLRKDQVSKIESGRRRVDVGELPRFAAALGVTVRHLLGEVDRPALALAARLAADAVPAAMAPARRRARQLLEIDDLLTQVADLPAARPSTAGRRVSALARAQFGSMP